MYAKCLVLYLVRVKCSKIGIESNSLNMSWFIAWLFPEHVSKRKIAEINICTLLRIWINTYKFCFEGLLHFPHLLWKGLIFCSVVLTLEGGHKKKWQFPQILSVFTQTYNVILDHFSPTSTWFNNDRSVLFSCFHTNAEDTRAWMCRERALSDPHRYHPRVSWWL